MLTDSKIKFSFELRIFVREIDSFPNEREVRHGETLRCSDIEEEKILIFVIEYWRL